VFFDLWRALFFFSFPVSFLCEGFTDDLDKCGFALKVFELSVPAVGCMCFCWRLCREGGRGLE